VDAVGAIVSSVVPAGTSAAASTPRPQKTIGTFVIDGPSATEGTAAELVSDIDASARSATAMTSGDRSSR
jgi:hypothetical protein